MKKIIWLYIFLFPSFLMAQTGTIRGRVMQDSRGLPFASIQVKNTSFGTISDIEGYFELKEVPLGNHTVVISFTGMSSQEIGVELTLKNSLADLSIGLKELPFELGQVVVTGTRTEKQQTNSPVVVNVITQKFLQDVQACNLSEGLRFQPGLRVETNCQTCNYTQLRMNGLQGGYSQILINGRPIFSPLTGLYGMEQLPANMIDRIEVIRGGGSALYGSGAVGGTVNVITRIPTERSYDMSYTFQTIGNAQDHVVNGNGSLVNKSGNAGVSLFMNYRNREAYDHNSDNFSEIPLLENYSFGTNFFLQPTENQKLELSFSNLNEYRYGGELIPGDLPASLAQQAEERTHHVYAGNLDYQINFRDDNSSLIAYVAAQHTDRDHFTGIMPDDQEEIQEYLENPPYGISKNTTLQGGVQYNHRFLNFPGGPNVVTAGLEYVDDDVYDEIESYNYLIDQRTQNLGAFLQSDWEVLPSLNLLTGLRLDHHNLVDRLIASPRVSLLYKLKQTTQFRFTYSTGFRAPQAFDTDLHIAFAGGGISRISLDPDLREERSRSLSGSVNFDKAAERFIAGFTLEGFHTYLKHAFILTALGEDEFGERFEKQNGQGARVSGGTLELRANYDRKIQLESGLTLQSSRYEEPVETLEGLPGKREFLRTPRIYGFGSLTITPHPRINSSINLVYTGPMEVAHFGGAPEQPEDAFVTTRSFTELGVRFSYTLPFDGINSGVEFFGGVRNLTNAYQDDFDSGKNRDSNYVYGPPQPRAYFVGVRIKSL